MGYLYPFTIVILLYSACDRLHVEAFVFSEEIVRGLSLCLRVKYTGSRAYKSRLWLFHVSWGVVSFLYHCEQSQQGVLEETICEMVLISLEGGNFC